MTLKPAECMYHSASLNGSPFAFRIKFKLVSLVAEGLYDLAPNVLQPQLPPYHPCYIPRGTVSTSRPITSLLSTTVHVIPTPRMSPLLSPLCLANSYPHLLGLGQLSRSTSLLKFSSGPLWPPAPPHQPFQPCEKFSKTYLPKCPRILGYTQNEHTANIFE